MRATILIGVMLILGISLHAQSAYQPFTTDTTKGAETNYNTAGKEVNYMGLATFDFTVSHDTATVILQGSNNSWTTAYDIDTASHNSTTAANYQLCANPVTYQKYRLKKATATGDTAYYTNILFIYKKY